MSFFSFGGEVRSGRHQHSPPASPLRAGAAAKANGPTASAGGSQQATPAVGDLEAAIIAGVSLCALGVLGMWARRRQPRSGARHVAPQPLEALGRPEGTAIVSKSDTRVHVQPVSSDAEWRVPIKHSASRVQPVQPIQSVSSRIEWRQMNGQIVRRIAWES